MKAKIVFIIVLLSLQGYNLFSQSISVELSITWETGHDIFIDDSMVYVPKLHITYRNMSNTNYYFLKISDDRDELPRIGCGISRHPMFSTFDEFMSWRKDYRARAKEYGNYAKQNFHVIMWGHPAFIKGWDVISDSLYFGEEKEIEFEEINCDLQDIYGYMYHSKNSEQVFDTLYFSPSDIIPENILSAVKDQFVFLKPNETFTNTYNLIGFKTIKGCFTFKIELSNFFGYVSIDPFLWKEPKMELPEKVGEFSLYTGTFHSNTVTICFDEKSK